MKSHWVRLGVVSICAMVLVGCNSIGILRGSGNVVRETRAVSGFVGVNICCGMHLVLRQADDVSVEIEADDNFLPEIESVVVGDELRVQYGTSARFTMNRFASQPVTVYVTMPTIDAVTVSGGGELTAEALTADEIAFSLSGGSTGEVAALAADRVAVELSGGSHLTLMGGEANQQSVETSGGSEYTAPDLASIATDISLSGGSHARIWVQESLTAESSGGSELAYYGTPTVEQDTSGGSEINSLGDH